VLVLESVPVLFLMASVVMRPPRLAQWLKPGPGPGLELKLELELEPGPLCVQLPEFLPRETGLVMGSKLSEI
jgi:hypothetical protein